MPKLQNKCPSCNKIAVEISRMEFPASDGGTKKLIRLQCGHIYTTESAHRVDNNITSLDGRSPYPFQLDGMKFLEEADFRALVADEMGLGKTIQSFVPIKTHRLTPALIVTKSGLRFQAQAEAIRWLGREYVPYVIQGSNDGTIPGFEIYIVSYDVLSRKGMIDKLKSMDFQYLIIDECQHIKNPDSKRTQSLRKLCESIPKIVALSGTPIKNRASEYFTILNILYPSIFPALNPFLYTHVDYYTDAYGKTKERGLKNPERFHELTKHFIIRRERKDVLPDLPSIDRKFFYIELGEKENSAYRKQESEFAKEYEQYVLEGRENSFEAQTNLLARIQKMRHITGIAKVTEAIEYTQDFIATTDRKLATFVHHQDVGLFLRKGLDEWCKETGNDIPLAITSDMDGDARFKAQQMFAAKDRHKILIASTLASGEGLNLQYQCSDALILERQWNPANEEQVEARFTRPDAISKDYVSVTYMIAGNTIDEWLTKLVEEKRAVFNQVMNNREADWKESDLMKELFSVTAKKGRELWKVA